MKTTCHWASCEANDWLGFWGSYLGAIGSFVMALIAFFALRKNNEQLEYIKKQNRPYLYASIRKVLHKKFGEGTIVAIKNNGGEEIGDIAFKGIGIKSLVLKLAPIELIE